MILFVAANPALDRTLEVDLLVTGQVHRPEQAVEVAGGKALNAARVVAALGGAAAVVALLGKERGEHVQVLLEADGVDCTVVPSGARTRICTSVLSSADGTMTELYEAGAPLAAGVWERFTEEACRRSLDRQVTDVVVSGSLPPGVGAEQLAVVLRAGAAAGRRFAVDLAGTALAAACEAGPDLVKVNRHEAAEIAGGLGTEAVEDLVERVAALAPRPCTVIVTAGPEGAWMATADGERWRARPPSCGPYTVACGDAFFGGLLAARQAGTGWRGALCGAIGAASANAERPGAGCIDAARARHLSSSTLVESWR